MKSRKLFFAFLLAFLASACRDKPPQTKCIYGDDIPAPELEAITILSEDVITLMLQKKYKDIHALGSEEMKQYISADRFAFIIDTFVTGFGELDYPRVQEAYLMSGSSKEPQVKIPCNLGLQGANDIYHMPPGRELAVTMYQARTDYELMRIIFQLEKEQGVWRLRSLNLFPATIKHKFDRYYNDQAGKFRDKNMLHAAYLYYKTAILLTEIGLNVDEATAMIVADRMSQIKVDYMPEGDVQMWSIPDGETYQVYNVDAAYDKGKLLVHVSYITDSLKDEEKLKKEAADIAGFLDKKFPEYREGFDGIRVTAAPDRREEMMTAWHQSLSFEDLDKLKAGKTE